MHHQAQLRVAVLLHLLQLIALSMQGGSVARQPGLHAPLGSTACCSAVAPVAADSLRHSTAQLKAQFDSNVKLEGKTIRYLEVFPSH